MGLPGLADIDHVEAVWTGLPEVGLHMDLQVFGADVALSCDEHLNVLGGCIKDWGEI